MITPSMSPVADGPLHEDSIGAGGEVDTPMASTNEAFAVASGLLRSVGFRVVKVPVTV